ncbi:MAG: DUF1254 domain-containing protein [Rhodobacter sp.]|nr:DUF1254 domain-containing protein [Paracoccaceae bacterium]MCC0076444.1 DUF1254 domain-containing protein [Rhodobacter sp.]
MDGTEKPALADSPDMRALHDSEAFAVGYHAFVWGYPYVKGMLLRHGAMHPRTANHAPLNTMHYYTTLARPGFHDFTPTVEALMNVGWVDLSQGPVLFDIPDIDDRYWSVVLVDAVGDAACYLGSRQGSAPGAYALVPLGWGGALPAGVTAIPVRSRFSLLLLRTLVRPEVAGDLDRSVALHAAMVLRPLDPAARVPEIAAEAPVASARPDTPLFHTLDFFARLNQALDEGGVMPGEEGVVAQFAGFGIGPGLTFAPEALSEAQRAGLLRGMQAAHQRIAAELRLGAVTLGGWQFNYDVGAYGHRYMTRATAALFGFGAMIPEETLYVVTTQDCAGAPLDGTGRYAITFAPGQLPPVRAFWSITVYTRPANQLVANAIDRYSVSSQTPGLIKDADGTLRIALQHARPEDPVEAANWLPLPDGAFWLILRTYVPEAPLLERAYTPPPVVRLNGSH